MPKFKPALHDNLLSHEQQALVTVEAIRRVFDEWQKFGMRRECPLDEAIIALFHRGQELDLYYSGYRTAKNEEGK